MAALRSFGDKSKMPLADGESVSVAEMLGLEPGTDRPITKADYVKAGFKFRRIKDIVAERKSSS